MRRQDNFLTCINNIGRENMLDKKATGAGKKWLPAPEELVRLFDSAVSALPKAEKRKMFGYPCAFINGQMFTGLFQESMFLRLSGMDRAEFLETFDTALFEPMPGRPMREYVLVPSSLLGSMPQLAIWLEKSCRYAESLPPKAAKRKALKKGRSK